MKRALGAETRRPLHRLRSYDARYRSAEETLAWLIPRLRDLLARAGVTDSRPVSITHAGLRIDSFLLSSGVTFSIFDGSRKLMTGALDPEPAGNHLGGSVQISWWRRGAWESAFRS